MVGLCAGWGKQQNVDAARDCIARVRRECLTAIASTLKQYRSTKMRWHVLKVSSSLNSSQLHFYRTATHKQLKCIVCRLQHLKEVHLILGSIDRLQEDSIEYIAIQEIYKKYQNSVKKLDFYTEVAVTRVRDSVPHVTSTKDELWWIFFLIFLIFLQTVKQHCNPWQFDMYFRSTVGNIVCSVVQLENPKCFEKFYTFFTCCLSDYERSMTISSIRDCLL